MDGNRLGSFPIRVDGDVVLAGRVVEGGADALTPLGGLLAKGFEQLVVPAFTTEAPVRPGQPSTPLLFGVARFLVLRSRRR